MNIIITCTATGPQLSSFSIMIIIFIIINIIVIVIFSDAGLYKCRVDFYRAPTQISEVALSVIGDQSSRSPSPKKICEEVFSLLMFGVKSQFGQIWQLSAWTLLVRREMVFHREKGDFYEYNNFSLFTKSVKQHKCTLQSSNLLEVLLYCSCGKTMRDFHNLNNCNLQPIQLDGKKCKKLPPVCSWHGAIKVDCAAWHLPLCARNKEIILGSLSIFIKDNINFLPCWTYKHFILCP